MIKRRARPTCRAREASPGPASDSEQDENKALPLSELLELRRLRKTRQGIDVHKLSNGDHKRRRRPADEVSSARPDTAHAEEPEPEDAEARARRAVRTNHFTQQTNALDVDKHMMAYIEQQLRVRREQEQEQEQQPADAGGPSSSGGVGVGVGVGGEDGDGDGDAFALSERWRERRAANEGSVTSSMAMLTAIPEVDLGMDTRLRNIEETEKAKRQAAEERRERKRVQDDEAHLVATRFYRPHLKQRSDVEIMREAKLEAMGLAPQEERRPRHDKPQMATDEMVMERFKKRMRK